MGSGDMGIAVSFVVAVNVLRMLWDLWVIEIVLPPLQDRKKNLHGLAFFLAFLLVWCWLKTDFEFCGDEEVCTYDCGIPFELAFWLPLFGNRS